MKANLLKANLPLEDGEEVWRVFAVMFQRGQRAISFREI